MVHGAVQPAPPFLSVVYLLDDLLRGAQSPELVLHGVFKDSFLFEDQVALLLVVGCAGWLAVAVPPCEPAILDSGTAVVAAVSAFFAAAGAVKTPRAGAEEGGFVTQVAEEERGETAEDDDNDDVF